MIEFTERERRACRLLSHLKYDRDTDKYTNCWFNNMLCNISYYILKVNPCNLFEKVSQYVKEKGNS